MCTGVRFSDGEGNMYFARNLDWCCSYGERVVITPTGYRPTSPFGATTEIRWPVIGMGIVEQNVPLYFDCANQAGLAVAGLNFPGYASYESDAVAGKTNVASWELPLWIVSRFSTVDEVEAALADVAVVDKPVSDRFPTSLLHWIVGDATRGIAIEYTADGMHVFDDDVDVLTNQPGFAWHRENLRNYLNVTSDVAPKTIWDRASLEPYGSGGAMRGMPGDYYSPSRFVRIAYLNANYPVQQGEKANVSRMFHELGGVSMIDGAARMTNGQFETTVYTGGFSSRTNTYYYTTYDEPAIRSVALADHDTSGSELIEVADPLRP